LQKLVGLFELSRGIKINTKQKRRDVQLLRGVAVIGVVLYHGNPAQFAQGWLGVDVFFVISGFVIAPKLFEIWSYANDNNRVHKLLRFYESRVIRLAPTFAFTVAAFGTLLYLFGGWSEIRHFSAQSLAASLGLGNLEAINQSQSNYFRPNPNAFLHTWSLSVETQIYLLAPFIFFLIARSSKKLILLLVGSGFILFLQLVIEASTNLKGEIFFSPISRLWEFGIGSALFLTKGKKYKSLVGYVALLLLQLIFILPHGFKFYNIAAVVLTCVILSSDINSRLNGRYNSIVKMGDISYTIYLIHLPLLHLCDYLLFQYFWIKQIIYILATIFLGNQISKRIEMKSNQELRKVVSGKRILVLIAICIIPIAFSLFFRVTSVNYLNMSNPPKLQGTNTCQSSAGDIYCDPGGDAENSIMLVGDSHANAISRSFIEIARQLNLKPIVISGRGCRLEPMGSYGFSTPCDRYMKSVKLLSLKENVKYIVISQRGFAADGSTSWRNGATSFIRAGTELHTNTNQVLILGPNPEFLTNRSQGTFSNLFQKNVYKKTNEFHEFEQEDNYLNKLAAINGIEYLSSSSIFCNKHECVIKNDGKYLYWDENHLSLDGAEYLRPHLLKAIQVRISSIGELP